MNSKFLVLLASVLSLFAVGSQSVLAAAPDVTAVVTEIAGSSVPIALIGSAVLLVIVGIMVFKWVRRAM